MKKISKIGIVFVMMLMLAVTPSMAQWDLYTDRFLYVGGGDAIIRSDGNISLEPDYDVNISGDTVPSITDMFDLGLAGLRWKKLWVTDADIGNDLDVGGDLDVTDDIFCNIVYCDGVYTTDYIAHRGDPNTFIWFNDDEVYFNIGGVYTMELTPGMVEIWNNLTVNGMVTADSFHGDGGNLTNINASNLIGDISLENISVNNISEYNGYGIHFLNDINTDDKIIFNDDYEIYRQGLNGNILLFEVDSAVDRDFLFRNLGGGDARIGINAVPSFALDVFKDTSILRLHSDAEHGGGMAGMRLDVLGSAWLISNENAYNNDLLFRDVRGDRDCMFIKNETGNVHITYDLNVTGNVTANAFHGDGGNLTNINASNVTGTLSTENIFVNNISQFNNYGIHFLNNITFPYTAQIHGGGLGTDLNLYNLDGTLTLTADTIILASADPLSLGTILNMNDNRITNIGDARTDFDNSGNLEFGDYNGIEFGNTTDAKIFWNNADSSLDISNDVNISGACTADAFHGDGGNLTNVSGLGSAYWNRSGATLYPYYDGDDLQVNGSITADAFFGDGGNLTNITGTGNPFNQWLNTTDNASFTYLDIVNDANITGDLTVDDNIILGDKLEFRPPGANDQGFYYYNDTGVLKAQVLYRGSLIPASDYFGIWNNGAKGMWFFNDGGDLRFYQRGDSATEDMEWYTKNAAGTSIIRMQLDNKVDASYLQFISNAHINLWDNNRIAFGNGKDAWMYYDTTDLIIDPDVVGSGELKIEGDVNITGDLIVTENITGNFFYAEAYNHYHPGVAINFVQDVYYNLTFNASDDLNGFTFDGDCNLTCNKPGLYSVNFQASGDGVNNHQYYLSVGINGISQNKTEVHKKITAGGDILTMSGTGLIRLANNDYVSLMIVDVTGNGAGNYYGSNLNLVRIGD